MKISILDADRIYGTTPCRLDVVPSTSPMQWDNGTWRSSKSSMPRRQRGRWMRCFQCHPAGWIRHMIWRCPAWRKCVREYKEFPVRTWEDGITECFPSLWASMLLVYHGVFDLHISMTSIWPYDLWYLWAFCMLFICACFSITVQTFESSSNLSGSETWCNQGKKAQISRSSQAGHGKVQRFLLQKTLSPTASPTAGFREGRLKPKCGDDEELSKKLCDDWKLMAFMGRTRILNDDQSAQLRI